MRLVLPTCAALLALASESWAQGAATEEPRPASDDPVERGEAAAEEQDGAQRTRVACLDDDAEGRERKGVQKRDFLKRHRFEVAPLGGFYASDVVSSTYTYGGAVSYFPSEDFGLEVLATRSRVEFRLEEPFSAVDRRRRFEPGASIQVMGALLFSPIHAKFKVTETAIAHGDIFLLAGAGQTFHDSVQGVTWQAGFGLKLYLARFLSFRLDVRDFVLPQEVLGRGRITHNVSVLGGLGVWLL